MQRLWAPPRVLSALDRIAKDQQRLARRYMELAASYEDGTARGTASWLAAKHCEHFAEHISRYDPTTLRLDLPDLSRFLSERANESKRRNWRQWKSFLRRKRP